MKHKDKGIGKLQIAILLRTVLPMLLLAVLIAGVAIFYSQRALKAEINRSLSVVATSVEAAYNVLYPGDYELVTNEPFVSLYKGDRELTGDFSVIDGISGDNGMEITLFYKDARILTTLEDTEGVRLVGTGVNAAIYGQVERNDEMMFFEPEIDGVKYYTCYRPLHNSDGEMIGMVATGLTSADVSNEMRESIYPVWVITVLGLLTASFISLRYTSTVTACITTIRAFLMKMVGGALDNELDEEIGKRRDELGDTANALVKMQKAVRILVERDPLTTLYNRRYGNAKLRNLANRSEKTGEPFALAIGDIDFFKKVNDTYGHDAGDVILKFVSEELKLLMSGRGAAVRWGGEEFLLMFENHTLGMAAEAIEGFLEKIRNSDIGYDGQVIHITMTMGLVPGENGIDLQKLIKQADEKLYYGKENGRNQLVVDRSLIREDVVQKAEGGGEVVLGFSEGLLESEELLQMLTENVARQVEKSDKKEDAD